MGTAVCCAESRKNEYDMTEEDRRTKFKNIIDTPTLFERDTSPAAQDKIEARKKSWKDEEDKNYIQVKAPKREKKKKKPANKPRKLSKVNEEQVQNTKKPRMTMEAIPSLSHVNYKVDFFDQNREEDYRKKIDQQVLEVIKALSKIKIEDYSNIDRYDFKTIRNFLVANKCHIDEVIGLITSDISWRKKKFPFETALLTLPLTSERIYLYGSDKDMNPCFYFKPFSKLGNFYDAKESAIRMTNYLDYMVYCFETCNKKLKELGFNTTFTMIVDCDHQKIDLDSANFYFNSIWDVINKHYPCKMTKIHLIKVELETTHMIHELRQKGVVYHDELYVASLLEYFNQYQLSQDYGGCAFEEYDITKLQLTSDLPGFITSYVKLKNDVTPY
ncbi:unnamed protein product [Moneuplotes crassus]|uniref:CRAL-TRIO domain-containing protein n=1 Tax=Euplotes crassus TaxID=5936 RepID=A0AAD1U926_EUPCR|nr:unnamed protein product [Moneuplotes crassus]